MADAEIRNGARGTNGGATRFDSQLVFPVDPTTVEPTISAVCELADALDVGAGFVAVEPTYHHAHRLALGLSKPPARRGVSTRRRIERRGRDWHQWDRERLLAGPEWGTFLGAQHLAKLDLEQLRKSGAFARIIEIAPGRLAFLQVTNDPEDDLRDEFEERLAGARAALVAIAMDLSDVNLDG